jgi:predicted transposase YdaD
LLSAAINPTAPALVQALARVAGSSQAAELDDVIAAIQLSRFNGRSIQELCAMGGISLDDFTQSVAYREMLGRGRCKVRPEEKLREKPRSACAS